MYGTQEEFTGVTTRRAGAVVTGIHPRGPRVDDDVHTRTETRRHLEFGGFLLRCFALEFLLVFPDSPLTFVKMETAETIELRSSIETRDKSGNSRFKCKPQSPGGVLVILRST